MNDDMSYPKFDSSDYMPKVLALMINRKCFADCDHCIVDATLASKELLDLETATEFIEKAEFVGMEGVLLYGGESFMHYNRLMLPIIKSSLEHNLTPVLSSNGFWGKSQKFVKKVFSDMNELGERYDKRIGIGLSIDKYHQKKIPVESLANIVSEYKLGNHKNTFLGFHTMRDEESDSYIDELFKAAPRAGTHLLSTNDDMLWYAARPDEVLEVIPENYDALLKKLGLEDKDIQRADDKKALIMSNIQLKMSYDPHGYIARQFDAGSGMKKYIIIPEQHGLMECSIDDLVNAGRAKQISGNNQTSFWCNYSKNISNQLIIAPDGNAYAYPGQIPEKLGGVPAKGKGILALIMEMRDALGDLPQFQQE